MRTLILLAGMAMPLLAQKHQVALTLGGITPQAPLAGGTALQANYGFRLYGGTGFNLHLETHLLASMQRQVELDAPSATTDVASLFITPALRFTFRPEARVRPWISGGGGYALFEQSERTVDGSPNTAPRNLHRGALQVGGGGDFTINRWLALRGEIRYFRTGAPAFNVPGQSGGQNHLVLGGGFVLNFGNE